MLAFFIILRIFAFAMTAIAEMFLAYFAFVFIIA